MSSSVGSIFLSDSRRGGEYPTAFIQGGALAYPTLRVGGLSDRPPAPAAPTPPPSGISQHLRQGRRRRRQPPSDLPFLGHIPPEWAYVGASRHHNYSLFILHYSLFTERSKATPSAAFPFSCHILQIGRPSLVKGYKLLRQCCILDCLMLKYL